MYTTVGTYYSFLDDCCIHAVVPPDDGPRYARNTYRLTKYTKNKLCIKLVFLYTIHVDVKLHIFPKVYILESDTHIILMSSSIVEI